MMKIILFLLSIGTAIAQSCKSACSTCSTAGYKSASCMEYFETAYIARPDCTTTETLGEATLVITETAVVTTFVTPTVTFLQTSTIRDNSTVIFFEPTTTLDFDATFEITTTFSTVPTLTETGPAITVTAAEKRRKLRGRYYPRLDPDCSCFLTQTETVTVTPEPGFTATATVFSTTTEFSTITYNSTVSTTLIEGTTTSTSINGTVTLTSTETISGTETVISFGTTVTEQSTVTVPAVQLASPTPVFGDVVNGSPTSYDDIWAPLFLPFPIEMYSVSSSSIYLSINGFISLDQAPSTSFVNSALPVPFTLTGANQLPNTAICGLWDDLYIYAGTQQGIYYQINGTAPARTISFEFYTSAYQRSTEFYHFIMTYQEAVPNVMTFHYFEVFGGGVSATIGAQSRSQNLFTQWSFNLQDAVSNGQTLRLDTIANTITSV